MKKFIICLFLSVFMISCVNSTTNKSTNSQTPVIIENMSETVNISKYTFEGHDYQFHSIHAGLRSGIGGPVHDPECRKCKQDSIK